MSSSSPCVVGLNLGAHDGGAALVTDTQMIAISEERLNRHRYSPGWQASLLYVLKAAGLRLEDVDLFVASTYGMHPLTPAQTGLAHLGVSEQRIRTADHHLAHAYSAYCLSPFEQATVVVCDGAGNNTDTESYYLAGPGGLEREGGNDPDRPRYGGIGATYEAFTEHCGWHAQEAGKTMALASFGNPARHTVPLFSLTDDLHVIGRLPAGHARGVAAFAAQHGLDFGRPGGLGLRVENVDAAAYLQEQTEQILLALTGQVIKHTGVGRLCLAGGVALNCVANDKISKLAGVEDLFVPPPASDRGQALGCALYGWHQFTGQMPRRTLGVDAFGRPYDDADIELALRRDPRSA
ncbi:carbamoyltransferase N-terminal domain-containing protein [Sphaerisporangium sp. NPDC051017]|uniref:carbamoyltransferase N-terminal domain-containing protein n=1 Tax=Sphaerisporangium sp. NPDC051017 TaxID=3154636 RepID=UPI00342698F9